MQPLKVFSRLTHDARIFIAGHNGLVGSAVVRRLRANGFSNLLLRNRGELDLLNQAAVGAFFREERPDVVFMCAAKVGGILANSTQQADFIYENITIASNVVHSAAEYDVQKLVFLGSSCIYPKHAPQPIPESALLSGPLEPTNEGYAIAKIAGLKMCEKFFTQYGKCFVSVMPTNMYGPNDNYHPSHSHVIPGLIRRFHEAKEEGARHVIVWGTGTPRREFLYVDDCADALLAVAESYNSPEIINIGTGEDVTIRELATTIARVVGFSGEVLFDPSKPDGTPRKVLDVAKIRSLGWAPQVSLEQGLQHAYAWALSSGAFNRAESSSIPA